MGRPFRGSKDKREIGENIITFKELSAYYIRTSR